MKRLTIEILALFILFGCVRADIDEPAEMSDKQTRTVQTDIAAFSSNYCWYRDRKIPLTPTDKSYKIFRVAKGERVPVIDGDSLSLHIYSARLDSTGLLYGGIVPDRISKSALGRDIEEVYSIPCFRDNEGNEVKISNLFFVILKQASDEAYLRELADANRVTVIGEDPFLSLWYTLSCDHSSTGNALEMSNLFHETNRFAAVSPGTLCWRPTSADPLYEKQWNLKNTGQVVDTNNDEVYNGTPNMDIGYEAIKPYIPETSDVIVAVLDDGVISIHEDMVPYKHWDAVTGNSYTKTYGSHGTKCAGVIASIPDNNIGIAGIAPCAKILGIGFDYDVTRTEFEKNACRAIDYAISHGASILSCSWEGNYSAVLDSYLKKALSEGRNGKGCVVVFSAGNDNKQNISFPARGVPEILCVGAINPNGKRVVESGPHPWGSNYGSELDVVAPGTGICTTDFYFNTYEEKFGGTSAACPQTAAVAALILAFNPDLTGKQVNDIIESTATKLGSYGYTRTAEHPQGSWNEEVGYGMLNAYDAVMAAIPAEEIHDKTFSQSKEYIRQSLTFNRVTVNSRATLSAKSIIDFIKFKSLTLTDKAALTSQSKRNSTYEAVRLSGSSSIESTSERDASWENVQVAGTSQLMSVSERITTLKNASVVERGKLTASASGIRVTGPFRVEKGAELRLQSAGGK